MTANGTPRSARDVFADVLRALEPYARDVVVIGGWVHALYLADAKSRGEPGGGAVHTDDVDLTIPRHLAADGRPQLIDLITRLGFERDPISNLPDAPIMLRRPVGTTLIDLDILTESPNPRSVVPVHGQTGLQVAGYPGQQILLENTEWMSVGSELHPSLDPPVEIRVPTLPAYVFHKGLSSAQRETMAKRAKDLVYMAEIIRHQTLGPVALAGIRDIADRYPPHYTVWRQSMQSARDDRLVLRDAAEQMVAAGQAMGTLAQVADAVERRIRRVLLAAEGEV